MGVINVTPDSFSDGGQFDNAQAAADHALALANEGATILDIGGESTRPGAEDVSVSEEIDRTIPVIEKLIANTETKISIDTRKPDVMVAAKAAGAHMINDVSALTYAPESLEVAVTTGLSVILMHAQGAPKTMQHKPQYDDVVKDIIAWLGSRIAACTGAGILSERIVVDPGIGFGKTLEHNLILIKNLAHFHDLGCPILLGASRKSFVGAICSEARADRRLAGSLVAVLAGLRQGTQFVRVHDVAETRQAILTAQALGEF